MRMLIGLLTLLLVGCQQPVSQQIPEVVRTLPHAPEAFTQGLLLHNGRFYESTGQYGSSSLREVDPETAEVIRIRQLEPRYFGEGLARVDDRLIQLTWRENTAFVYNLETFDPLGSFSYPTEGWGLCYDGEVLYMSDGSATLYRRNPVTFELLGQLEVTQAGKAVQRLNELECVGDSIYANIFLSSSIVKIDKRSGRVQTEIDASGLLPLSGRPNHPDAVLNGIAYDPATELFYLTGKLWPTMFEVRFVNP